MRIDECHAVQHMHAQACRHHMNLMPAAVQVFPTAEHTRYQHSCGVAGYAYAFAKHISATLEPQFLDTTYADLDRFRATRTELAQVRVLMTRSGVSCRNTPPKQLMPAARPHP